MKPYRIFSLFLVLLMSVACGPEAPARSASSVGRAIQSATPLLQAERPTPPEPQLPDVRTMGDPNAPIVVIEYGDYQ